VLRETGLSPKTVPRNFLQVLCNEFIEYSSILNISVQFFADLIGIELGMCNVYLARDDIYRVTICESC